MLSKTSVKIYIKVTIKQKANYPKKNVGKAEEKILVLVDDFLCHQVYTKIILPATMESSYCLSKTYEEILKNPNNTVLQLSRGRKHARRLGELCNGATLKERG